MSCSQATPTRVQTVHGRSTPATARSRLPPPAPAVSTPAQATMQAGTPQSADEGPSSALVRCVQAQVATTPSTGGSGWRLTGTRHAVSQPPTPVSRDTATPGHAGIAWSGGEAMAPVRVAGHAPRAQHATPIDSSLRARVRALREGQTPRTAGPSAACTCVETPDPTTTCVGTCQGTPTSVTPVSGVAESALPSHPPAGSVEPATGGVAMGEGSFTMRRVSHGRLSFGGSARPPALHRRDSASSVTSVAHETHPRRAAGASAAAHGAGSTFDSPDAFGVARQTSRRTSTDSASSAASRYAGYRFRLNFASISRRQSAGSNASMAGDDHLGHHSPPRRLARRESLGSTCGSLAWGDITPGPGDCGDHRHSVESFHTGRRSSVGSHRRGSLEPSAASDVDMELTGYGDSKQEPSIEQDSKGEGDNGPGNGQSDAETDEEMARRIAGEEEEVGCSLACLCACDCMCFCVRVHTRSILAVVTPVVCARCSPRSSTSSSASMLWPSWTSLMKKLRALMPKTPTLVSLRPVTTLVPHTLPRTASGLTWNMLDAQRLPWHSFVTRSGVPRKNRRSRKRPRGRRNPSTARTVAARSCLKTRAK